VEIRQLTKEEEKLILFGENLGNILIKKYFNKSTSKSKIELLDITFKKWLSDKSVFTLLKNYEIDEDISDKPTADMIVLGLGAILGNLIIDETGANWVLVKDDYGETHGIYFESPTFKHMNYPFDSIYKRVNSRETGFFKYILQGAVKDIKFRKM